MPLPQLNVHRHDEESRSLITIAGEIDLSTVSLVSETLKQCLRDGIRAIDVDLAPVPFCDCSGLNAFVEASRNAVAAGGTLRLHHPPAILARIVALTGSGFLLGGLPAPHGPPSPPEGVAPTTPLSPPPSLRVDLHRLAPAVPAAVSGVL
ncbi:STAS domain-containing protein [Streptomyces sp. NBC_00829]|uniref:STAS domain-containing protein n=1 Tax=Streptomyces sp. NBC_00829 TaxID=2903679 RepID=UPI0038679BA3|nr:STAS domain-containing protein [Streptomyces sp. NBC_00829]